MTRALGILLAVVLAGCAATPDPTPTEPTPVPTPQVITVEVEVEVTPRACLDAIDDLMASEVVVWELMAGILDDYLDFPDESLGDFGLRFERRIAGFDIESTPDTPTDAIAECRAAA